MRGSSPRMTTQNFTRRSNRTARVAEGNCLRNRGLGGNVAGKNIRLSDDERVDWLRLIRSENIGPRGIMAQRQEHFD